MVRAGYPLIRNLVGSRDSTSTSSKVASNAHMNTERGTPSTYFEPSWVRVPSFFKSAEAVEIIEAGTCCGPLPRSSERHVVTRMPSRLIETILFGRP